MSIRISTGPDLQYEKDIIREENRPASEEEGENICAECKHVLAIAGQYMCKKFRGDKDIVSGRSFYLSCESRRVPLRESRAHRGAMGEVNFTTRGKGAYCGIIGIHWEPKPKKEECESDGGKE